jgi:hypothetical protein
MDLIPNLSLSLIAYPSIRPLRLSHVTAQSRKNQLNSSFAERKQIADRGFFCRTHLKKPSFHRTDFSLSWTHKSDSLPNFGVNRGTSVSKEEAMGHAISGQTS